MSLAVSALPKCPTCEAPYGPLRFQKTLACSHDLCTVCFEAIRMCPVENCAEWSRQASLQAPPVAAPVQAVARQGFKSEEKMPPAPSPIYAPYSSFPPERSGPFSLNDHRPFTARVGNHLIEFNQRKVMLYNADEARSALYNQPRGTFILGATRRPLEPAIQECHLVVRLNIALGKGDVQENYLVFEPGAGRIAFYQLEYNCLRVDEGLKAKKHENVPFSAIFHRMGESAEARLEKANRALLDYIEGPFMSASSRGRPLRSGTFEGVMKDLGF